MKRFVIESENEKAYEQFYKLAESGELSIITEYDPIERLTARVEKMRLAFQDFKKNRGNWRILNYYLRGRGISQGEIDKVLAGVEEFMKQVESNE